MSRRPALLKRACLSLLLVGLITPAANAQGMPTTTAGFYRAGERFAQCSAHFAFGAQIARNNGLPDNATAFEGMERGWRLAGLVLLAEGLDPSRQADTQEMFANLQTIEIDQLKASRELFSEHYSKMMVEEYQAKCLPWADLQKSIIAAMRSGPRPQD